MCTTNVQTIGQRQLCLPGGHVANKFRKLHPFLFRCSNLDVFWGCVLGKNVDWIGYIFLNDFQSTYLQLDSIKITEYIKVSWSLTFLPSPLEWIKTGCPLKHWLCFVIVVFQASWAQVTRPLKVIMASWIKSRPCAGLARTLDTSVVILTASQSSDQASVPLVWAC